MLQLYYTVHTIEWKDYFNKNGHEQKIHSNIVFILHLNGYATGTFLQNVQPKL